MTAGQQEQHIMQMMRLFDADNPGLKSALKMTDENLNRWISSLNYRMKARLIDIIEYHIHHADFCILKTEENK